MENAALLLLPETGFGQMVKEWGEWDPVTNKGQDVEFRAMSSTELKTLIRMITNPVMDDGTRMDQVQIVEGGGTVDMRSNNFKSLQSFLGQVRMIHDQGGTASPTEDLDVKKILLGFARSYEADGVRSVDPVEFLPAVYSAIWLTDLYKTDFERLYTWALFLVMWNLLGRPCEVRKLLFFITIYFSIFLILFVRPPS